jgi:hypothetical protein
MVCSFGTEIEMTRWSHFRYSYAGCVVALPMAFYAEENQQKEEGSS